MLLTAATESMIHAVEVFNRPDPTARVQTVLILSAHAFEMLLKAAIFQNRRTIREPRSDYTYSFEKCINIAADDLSIVDVDDRSFLLSLKQDRDAAAHDYVTMTDELLWLKVRSAVTVFDRVLQSAFGESLEARMPRRVLPVAAGPPADAALVIDREVEQVVNLLQPGRRRSAEARGHIRVLLALDGSATGRAEPPSELEVGRAETALKKGRDWRVVFPGLSQLQVVVDDDGSANRIRLVLNRSEGEFAVRRASPDEEGEALLYREVNYFDKYGIKLTDFGARLGLSMTQGYAVIYALDLKNDPDCYYVRRTPAGNVQFQGLSQAAVDKARQALDAGQLSVADAVGLYRARSTAAS